MKGTIFLKPLEYNIIADGQRWHQGEKIIGVLKVKNHSNECIDISDLKISLEAGNFKKIKSRDKKSWECLSEALLSEKMSLDASEEKEFNWNFQLPEDCQITDKGGSVFLTFKDHSDSWPLGLLELVIDPKILMSQILEIFVNYLRFKVVQTKYSKGMVEVKLNPPGSKDLSHVESLILRMKEVDKNLDLEFLFNMHVFETVAGNVMTQKKIKQIDMKLDSKQYYINGMLNHEFVLGAINGVIKEITPKFFVS